MAEYGSKRAVLFCHPPDELILQHEFIQNVLNRIRIVVFLPVGSDGDKSERINVTLHRSGEMAM